MHKCKCKCFTIMCVCLPVGDAEGDADGRLCDADGMWWGNLILILHSVRQTPVACEGVGVSADHQKTNFTTRTRNPMMLQRSDRPQIGFLDHRACLWEFFCPFYHKSDRLEKQKQIFPQQQYDLRHHSCLYHGKLDRYLNNSQTSNMKH